jgi:hypothetical protein
MSSLLVNSLWLIAVDPHRGGSISLRPVIDDDRGAPVELVAYLCDFGRERDLVVYLYAADNSIGPSIG